MNILITDIENALGNYLNSYLSKSNVIFGFTKDTLCLTDKSKTLDTIASIKPDVVIHTASLENLDLCEKDEGLAYTFNTIGSLNTAYPCSLLDIPIIYLSSSYVYNGEKQTSYYETDDCYPVNIFGKTKLASEKLIRTLCKKYFIIRTSWIFGGEDCFIQNVLDNKTAEVFMCTQEIGNPTNIEDICFAIERIIQSDLYGIYNCASPDHVSKFDWINYIFEVKNIKKELIAIPKDIINTVAPRPKNASLNTSMLKNCFDLELPHWKAATKIYLNKLH